MGFIYVVGVFGWCVFAEFDLTQRFRLRLSAGLRRSVRPEPSKIPAHRPRQIPLRAGFVFLAKATCLPVGFKLGYEPLWWWELEPLLVTLPDTNFSEILLILPENETL